MLGSSPSTRKRAGHDLVSMKRQEKARRAPPPPQEHQFFILLAQGNVELIYCSESDDRNQDAFTHDIFAAVNGEEASWLVEEEGIVMAAWWRGSRENHTVVHNSQQTRFPRRYYVRTVEESTPGSRRRILERLAEVSREPVCVFRCCVSAWIILGRACCHTKILFANTIFYAVSPVHEHFGCQSGPP